MIRVNLLPHREMRRRRLQKQFVITLGVVVLLGAGIWLKQVIDTRKLIKEMLESSTQIGDIT